MFNGRTYLMEEALAADYAFIRAWQCDGFGNTRYRLAQRNFGPLMAMAVAARSSRPRRSFLRAASKRTRCTRRASSSSASCRSPVSGILRITRNASLPDGAYASAAQRAEEQTTTKPRLHEN